MTTLPLSPTNCLRRVGEPVARRRAGAEQGTLADDDVAFHEAEITASWLNWKLLPSVVFCPNCLSDGRT